MKFDVDTALMLTILFMCGFSLGQYYPDAGPLWILIGGAGVFGSALLGQYLRSLLRKERK